MGLSYTRAAGRLPRFARRHILHFEAAIEDALDAFAASLPAGARVLDAGAGEGQYAARFDKQRYLGVDLAVGDASWNYRRLHAVADLSYLPFRRGVFEACINIVTLEHVRQPLAVLSEIGCALAPGGALLLVVPQEWEVHQAPHDYFRYTRYGLDYLLRESGFAQVHIQAVGGYFRLLARRLLNGLQFFTGGLRWFFFVPAAIIVAPPALLLPLLDPMDRDRNFTLGYICTARKPS